MLPPIAKRTYTLLPYTTLLRSVRAACLPEDGRVRFSSSHRHSGHVRGKREGSSSHGLKITAPLWRVSLMFRVTRKRSCRSEEHTSELQSLMRISYAVFCL